jgi:hypothetical protein
MKVARTPQAVRSGFYSPIQTEPGREVKAMPVFYGMMLANQFAGTKMLRVEGGLGGADTNVYAARRADAVSIAVLNKDATSSVMLTVRGAKNLSPGEVWRLEAPALGSTEGIRLGGAGIGPHAQWEPEPEALATSNGALRLAVPAASAALVLLGSVPAHWAGRTKPGASSTRLNSLRPRSPVRRDRSGATAI